ncbi:MAG TPA: phosphate ABC transporter permease PstA [Clostridia bacterium]|nr:phosphate ABC transporter permease PstA [Clostridia bacterium]
MNSRVTDNLATVMLWAGALLVLLLLGLLMGHILIKGIGVIDFHFLVTPPSSLKAGGGIGPQIFNSFYMLFWAMLLTVPVGLLAGIYLAEYATQGPITNLIRLCIETLSSLPSIVVGLFGLLVFVNMTGWGYSLMSGALALAVVNLPLMVRVSEEAIRSVSAELSEASLALGSTHWQTIWKVIVPSALPGLITGGIIAAGRVFGEAAALLYTSGMDSPILDFTDLRPWSHLSPLNPFRPAETLAVHIWKVNSESLIPDVARISSGSAAVLVLVVLMFNITARWLASYVHRRMTAS